MYRNIGSEIYVVFWLCSCWVCPSSFIKIFLSSFRGLAVVRIRGFYVSLLVLTFYGECRLRGTQEFFVGGRWVFTWFDIVSFYASVWGLDGSFLRITNLHWEWRANSIESHDYSTCIVILISLAEDILSSLYSVLSLYHSNKISFSSILRHKESQTSI